MSAKIHYYRDLEVWQRSMQLAEACYRLTNEFPPSERFSLTAQRRRAALSIPSNIAEGHARKFSASFVHHLDIALGSRAEVETCLDLAARLHFASSAAIRRAEGMSAEVGRLLHGLLRSLSDRPRSTFHSANRSNRPSTHDPRPTTHDPRPSTLDPRLTTLDPRPSTLDPRPQTLDRTRLRVTEVLARVHLHVDDREPVGA
jgi:four helix bundle protein